MDKLHTKTQIPGSSALDVAWSNEKVAIPVKCNIHPWMHAYIAVVKGPFGPSNEAGSSKLDNVPAVFNGAAHCCQPAW